MLNPVRVIFVFLLSAACFLLPPRAGAQVGWKIASSETMPAPADGVAHHLETLDRSRNAANDDSATEATLHFVSFDAGKYIFRVFDQNPRDNASLADTMADNHCIAGTNGGYFSPEFDPVGLLVCDGRVIRAEQHSRLLSGVLAVTSNHISLRRVTEPVSSLPVKHARQAVQCGPFLVEDRKSIPGLNGTGAPRGARRSSPTAAGAGDW